MNQFNDCTEITEALGYDPQRYSPYQTAAHWVREAGFEFTDTTGGVWSADRPPLAQRMGVYDHELRVIVEYQHHHVERRRHGDWVANTAKAQELVDWYATTDVPRERWLFDPAQAFDGVGPEPEFDQAVIDAAAPRILALAEADAEEQADEAEERDEELSDAVAAYKEREPAGQPEGLPTCSGVCPSTPRVHGLQVHPAAGQGGLGQPGLALRLNRR